MDQTGEDKTREQGPLWPFLLLTFAISWGIGGAWLAFPEPLTTAFGPFAYATPAYYVAAWAPTLAAVILTFAARGLTGVYALLRRLVRVGPAWTVAVAALALPAIALALSLLTPASQAWPVTPRQVLVATPLVLLTTAQIVTNSGPLGEELGWRGYALPRLLARTSPLAAGTILGLIWTLWHVPAFLFAGVIATPLSDLGWHALGTVGLSWLMTALFLRTRGGVLVAGVLPHLVINGLGAAGAWRSRPAEAAALATVGLTLLILSARPSRLRDRISMTPRPDATPN
uniref:Abortive infection protein n=1 Tax=Caulobacter sp. (strain K31) TaxID=366602 RepID=B0T347_CAUSK